MDTSTKKYLFKEKQRIKIDLIKKRESGLLNLQKKSFFFFQYEEVPN